MGDHLIKRFKGNYSATFALYYSRKRQLKNIKHMKSGLFFLLLSLTSLNLLAQPPTLVVSGKITGIVQDSVSNQGVEFATVALLDPATQKPINGEVCDDKGKFTLSRIPAGNYIVSISFIGYSTKTINVQVTEKKNEIDLGNVKLSPSAK